MSHRGAVVQTMVPALLVLLCIHCSVRGELTLRTAAQATGKYEKLELLVGVDRDYDNPFDPCVVQIDVLLTSPSGQSLRLPVFYAQDYQRRDFEQRGKTTAWYYPFAPMEVGTYTARASLKDANGQVFSAPVQFECTDSSRPGFLRTHEKDPRFLQFTEGEPFFVIGQNLAFVGVRPAGGKRGQLRAHLDLLQGLGPRHRGPQERLDALVDAAVTRGGPAGPR